MRIAYIETFMKESGYNITHSSIIYGFKKIQQNKLKDNDFKAIVKQIKECVTL